MARFRGMGPPSDDSDSAVEDGPALSPMDWTTLFADEDDFVYEGQAEINRQIASRLENEESSKTKQEVLTTLLEEQMASVAGADLFVLCTLSTATQLGVEHEVLAKLREDDVRSCVVRAQSRRLVLASHAEAFLTKHWGDWGDICKLTKHYPEALVQELAKLCKLGISKEDAKVRLRAHIYKRRIGKTPGIQKTPTLQKMDVRNVITEVSAGHMTLAVSSKSSKLSKQKRKKDTAYLPSAKKAKVDVDNQPDDSVENTRDAPSPPHSEGTPDLAQSIDEPPAHSDDTAREIEVGRSGAENLSDGFGSPVSDDCSNRARSSTPGDRHSTAPSSPPLSPSHEETKSASHSPIRMAEAQSIDDESERKQAPFLCPGSDVEESTSILGSEHPAPLWPTPSEPAQVIKSYISKQALRGLKEGQRITGSVVNAALGEYFSGCSDVFVVDSNDLARWDWASCWNASLPKNPADTGRAEPTTARRRRAQSARKFIIPFHHTILEHWSLFVAFHEGSSECWVFEHYDSLPQKGLDPFDMAHDTKDIVCAYLGWLLSAPITSTRLSHQECAIQSDGVNCGIYLLANAAAISRDCAVPTSIDPRSCRHELWVLLQARSIDSVDEYALPPASNLQTAATNSKDHDGAHANGMSWVFLDQPTTNAILDAFPEESAFTPSIRGPSGIVSHSPSDQPPINPVLNGSMEASQISPSKNDDKSSKVAPLRQKHTLEAQAELKALDKTLEDSEKALQDLETKAAHSARLHLEYSQQADRANRFQKAWDRNVENVKQMTWHAVSDHHEGPSKDTFLAQTCREAEQAKAEKMKCQERLQAALADRKALSMRLEVAKDEVNSQKLARRELEQYLKLLNGFVRRGLLTLLARHYT